jgi:ligand-binding sensor domain-containing protein/signal transduction histidine kinase
LTALLRRLFRRAKRLTLAGLASSLVAPPSAGAPSTVPLEAPAEFVIQSWQVEDGLPQGSVMSLLQSRAGDLWFGTQDGLVRFDGLTLKVFGRRASDLRSNYVRALAEDSGGTLWIGTSRGLSRRLDGAFVSYGAADGLAGDNVTALAVDPRGAVWVGTRNGLSRLAAGRFTTFRQRDGLAGDGVNALLAAPDGTLWVGTTQGLSRLVDGTFTTYTTRHGLPHDNVRALALDPTGQLWVGTASGPPLRLDADGRRFRSPFGGGWPTGAPQALLVDRQGRLWCGTRGSLVLVEGGRVRMWTTASGLSDDHVLSLFEDREGSLWIGTERGGLNRFKPPRLTAYTARHGLPEDTVLSVFEDGAGDLWLGTWRGLSRARAGEVLNFEVGDGLEGEGVMALAPARSGGLWLGHMRAGVSRFQDGRARRLPLPAGLPAFALHEDAGGTLWIGTDHGLLAWRDGRLTRLTHVQGTPTDTVFRIVPARGGGLWIATRRGLLRLLDGRLERVDVVGLPAESIVSLLEDPDGTLWIGTFGAGLARLRAGVVTTYTREQGLFDDTVYEILDDGLGGLWTSSNRGPSRVRRADLDDFDAGRVKRLTPTVFGRGDGMRRVECNGASQPVGWRARDGRLWFATVGGAVAFDPRTLPRNAPAPPPRVVGVLVDREPLDLRTAPRAPLPPSRGDLEFRYSARTLSDPEKVRFRYRLDGFDDDWHDAGARRTATYTNVPPGRYRFEVDAAHADGAWSGRPATFELALRPQFYQTAWFRALPLFVLALAGWGLHQRRMRRFESHAAVLAERHRMACELHDGLAQELSGLVRQLEVAQAELPPTAPGVAERLHRARELARSSLAGARRSVRALRPEALERKGLAEALGEAARQAVAGSGIRLDLEVTGTPRPLPPETEQHLFRTGQEALNNAVRHAGASSIRVQVAFRPRTVRVRVSDDGRGLASAAEAGGGFGIRGMRERMHLAGGKLRFVTRAGQGTEVAALVPVGRARGGNPREARPS